MFSRTAGGDCRLAAPARDWALPALAILLLAASLAWDAASGYRRSLEQEFRLLDAHARIADAHLTGALRIIEATLRETAASRLASRAFDPALQSSRLAEQARRIPEMQNLFLTDASGRIEAMSDPSFIDTDASQREYFTRPRSVLSDGIFISRPYLSKSGIVVMAVSRALRDDEGRFRGAAVASIKPAFFNSLLMAVHPDGAGFAFIANAQGDILQAAARQEWVGRNIKGGPAFAAHLASGERMTHHIDRTKHEPIMRLSVVRTLENAELLFFVGRDRDEVLAPWQSNTVNRLVIFLLASLALLYLGWRGQQHQRTLRVAQAGLHESEAHLRKAQQIARIGSWTYDPQSRRLSGTDETCRIYDFAPGEPVDIERIHSRIHPEDRAAMEQAWQAALEGAPFDLEHRLLPDEGGETRWVRAMVEPERAANGRIRSLIGVSRDISERKRAEQAIRQLNAHLEQRVRERTVELENSNRELESFSYSVSHDLRAPLRAIDGFSHVIAEDYGAALGEDGRSLMQRIRRATQKMGTLIDNLLDLAQVSRQKLKREPIDLSRLVGELAHEIAETTPGRQVAWIVHPGISGQGDPFLLKVALSNLLRNAWKFTARSEEPRIEFGSRIGSSRMEYFIRDNGAGIDMTYAGKLFQPFQRLHDPKEYEGTGIGLAIVHRVIQRHGGSIHVESRPGQETTFFFTLE